MTAATDSTSVGVPDQDRPVPATVVRVLPNEQFRLRLQDGSERVAHVAGNMRMAFTRLLPGDRVRIELSPFDSQKARIIGRLPAESA